MVYLKHFVPMLGNMKIFITRGI